MAQTEAQATIVEHGEPVGYINLDPNEDDEHVVYNGETSFLHQFVDDVNDGIRIGPDANDLGGPDQMLVGERLVEKFRLISEQQPDVNFEVRE